MQTPEEKAFAVNQSWKAFIAGALIGINAKCKLSLELSEVTEAVPNDQGQVSIGPQLNDKDRKTLRHAAHLLFPTEVTEEEFKDEC